MCKGLALLVNDKEVLTKWKTSHSEIKQNSDYDYLKIEIIASNYNDKGYEIQIDEDMLFEKDKYIEQALLLKSGKLPKFILNNINKFLENNQQKVYYALLFGCSGYKKVKGDCYNSYQEIKGDCDNSYQEIEGNCDSSSQEIKGDCSNSCQQVKGDCYNSHQIIEGDCYNSSQMVEGEIYIGDIKNNNKEVDDFIKKLSKKSTGLTWKTLVRYAIKGYNSELTLK